MSLPPAVGASYNITKEEDNVSYLGLYAQEDKEDKAAPVSTTHSLAVWRDVP